MSQPKPSRLPKSGRIHHGYGAYTNGCRCDVCTEAKRERQRALRAEKRRSLHRQQKYGSGGRHFVDGITHGHAGYVEFFCRCDHCLAGHTAQRARERTRHRLSPAPDFPGARIQEVVAP